MATPTIILVPVHLISLLEAAKRLLAHAGRALSLTMLVMRPPTEYLAAEIEDHVRREEAFGLDVRFVHLPAMDHSMDFTGIEEFVSRFVQVHAPHVRVAISRSTSPVAAVVLDFFCTTLIDVCRDLAVPA
ncbi:hypothetical protein C2845_PM11G17520 [Panicum miliaceum]|uniref:Uncharacterized protein n=1 Tax=Panicum miliaceum TaxID=4540 RepID=A0A3L6RTS1_PANMI|nr:hypothetical protein C2845_PM11G17520 [Panicum miliaceum]